jgi:hypothetical protein
VILVLGALLVVATFTFPLWRPLFTNKAVEEVYPGLPADLQDAFRALPQDQQTAYFKLRDDDPSMALAMVQAALGPATTVPPDQQATPDAPNPQVLASGSFIQIDAVRHASGKATVYQLPDNRRILRFDDFQATNGPDLHVLLAKNSAPLTAADVGSEGIGYRELARLKGNVGSQTYDIPADIDVSQFNSVVIYSVQFGVVFSTATLS